MKGGKTVTWSLQESVTAAVLAGAVGHSPARKGKSVWLLHASFLVYHVGLNAFLLCPRLYFCPPVFLGHLYPFQLSKDLHLGEARLRCHSAGNRLSSERRELHLKRDFYLTSVTHLCPCR